MNKIFLQQVFRPVIAFTLALGLLLPVNPTSALTEQAAPILPAPVYPDDPYYDTPGYDHDNDPGTALIDQWHYHGTYGINAPEAWGVTTGSANVVVAVLDTGITAHNDLEDTRILPGYDFVSDNTNHDSTGRDGIPDDPGDYGGACATSSWHGTHVAGIIGATSDNALGVAGIDWNADILPVRVTGTCGSVDVNDLVDGMLWAADVPTGINPNPADVIHVSASIPGQTCTTDYQDAVNAINAAGSIIVAPAGDANSITIGFPANCTGVITVAATDKLGQHADYSNYGSAVEISAPGGGNGQGDVLSTVNSGVTDVESAIATRSAYKEKSGTSLAAAHVSGVVSLMLAANPYMTHDQVLDILKVTATDFPAGFCTTSNCGAGIVNAGEAVRITSLPDLVITNVTLDPAVPQEGVPFNVNITVKNQGGAESGSLVYRNVYINIDPSTLEQDALGRPGSWVDHDDDPGTPNIWEPNPGSYSKQDLLQGIPPNGVVTETVAISSPLLDVGLYDLYPYTDANGIVAEGYEDNNHYPKIRISIGVLPIEFEKMTPANSTTNFLAPDGITLEWEITEGAESYEYCIDITDNNLCDSDIWTSVGTNTSVTLPGLVNSSMRYWQVRAKNGAGYKYADDPRVEEDDEGIWWAFRPMPVPVLSSPANHYLVTTMTPTLVVLPTGLSWNQFQVSSVSDFSTLLVDATVANTSYTLTTAQKLPYGTYYWRVRSRANNVGGITSNWSTTNKFGVTFQTAPLYNVYSIIIKPTFSWKAITGASKYRLMVSKQPDFSILEIDLTQTKTSYVSPVAMDYALYYWRVQALNASDVLVVESPVDGSRLTLTPPLSAVPVLLSPASKALLSDNTPTLTWKKVTDDDRYEVQVDNASTFASPEETFITSTGVLTHTLTAYLAQGTYYWRVRTSNYLSAPGKWSTARTFIIDNTPPSLAPVLSAPVDNYTAAGTPTFSWNTVIGAAKYQFQYDDASDFLNPTYTSVDLTTPKHIPPAMAVGTHFWRARAKDVAGNAGPWSGSRQVTITTIKPAVPVLTAPANALATNITTPFFTWNAVAYANIYEFQLAASSTFSSVLQSYSGAAPTYPATALVDGTYYWRVRAKNINNVYGSWSAATRSFRVDTIAPDAPVLNLPAVDAPASATPTFSWKASTTGATKYQFQYDDDSGFGSPYTSAILTTTSHIPKPAMPLGTYYWRVKAWDAANNESAWSVVRTVTILTAPTLTGPASGLLNANPTPTFTWNAVTGGNTYEIQISANTTFTDIRQTFTGGVGIVTYTATSLPSGRYYWHVRARNVLNMPGVWSSYRYFTIDITPPLAPVLSSPINDADVFGNPTFKWVAASTATKYKLQYATNDTFSTGVYTSAELTTTSHTPPPMAVGTYYWRVMAKDALGNEGPYSAGFKVDVLPDVPPKPALTAPANALVTNDPTPTFTWNAVVSGNTYDIQIATDIGFTTIIATLPTPTGLGSTSYTPTTILSDGLYYWRVRAQNITPAAGLWSTVRSFTVDTNGPAAPVLSSPANTVSVTGTPVFKWLASVTATKYRLQYATNDTFSAGVYTSGELTTTSLTPPTIPSGTYYWHVQARDAAGNWGLYTAVPFAVTITPTKPLAPVLTAPAISMVTKINTTPNFTWNAVAYGVNYEFQLSTSSTFLPLPLLQSYSGPALTYTSADILPDTTYYWRVRAVNSAAVAGAWSVVRLFRVDTQSPAVPLLNLPAIDAQVKGTPTFSWKASTTGATKYQFQYATNTVFNTGVYTSAMLTTISVKPPTMLLGTYYWHVKAWDAAGNESAWSDYRAVTVTPLVPAGIPVLVSPVNGSIILDQTPAVSWKAVSGAVSYQVQMDGNSTFSSPEFDGTTSSLEISSTVTLSNGVFYWRVRKIDAYGGRGVWSVVRRFSVNEVIPLAVTSPSLFALSDTFETSTPTLIWNSVEYGVTYQVQVDDNNDFNTPSFDDTAASTSRTVSATLSNGEYFWRVRAINSYGTPGPWSETWTISIDVPPAP